MSWQEKIAKEKHNSINDSQLLNNLSKKHKIDVFYWEVFFFFDLLILR